MEAIARMKNFDILNPNIGYTKGTGIRDINKTCPSFLHGNHSAYDNFNIRFDL